MFKIILRIVKLILEKRNKNESGKNWQIHQSKKKRS